MLAGDAGMNVFRTLMVPVAQGPLAVKITNALGNGHPGMFVVEVKDGATVGYISTGILDDASPILADAATLHAACIENDPTVTLADCESLVAALDLTPDEPFARMAEIKTEVAEAVNAPAWVAPTGAHNAYAKGATVTYAGKAWKSLIDANVHAPGISGWRESWGQTQAGYPAWVAPSGAHDAYPLNAMVTHNGKTWKNTGSSANVWEPGVFGWVEI